MLFVYPAVIHKEDGSHWVEFPDLPGCVTDGTDLTDTMKNAQEALEGYLMSLLHNKIAFEPASSLEDINKPADGFVTLVTCDIDPRKISKSVKKTLTIPSWLDDRAQALGINFSQALQEILMIKIQNR